SIAKYRPVMMKATTPAMNAREGTQLETFHLVMLLNAVGCVAALAVAAAWIACEWLQFNSPVGKSAVLASALLVAAFCAFLAGRVMIKCRRRVVRAIKLLCQTNFLELSDDRPLEDAFDRHLDPVM